MLFIRRYVKSVTIATDWHFALTTDQIFQLTTLMQAFLDQQLPADPFLFQQLTFDNQC